MTDMKGLGEGGGMVRLEATNPGPSVNLGFYKRTIPERCVTSEDQTHYDIQYWDYVILCGESL